MKLQKTGSLQEPCTQCCMQFVSTEQHFSVKGSRVKSSSRLLLNTEKVQEIRNYKAKVESQAGNYGS